MGSEKTQFATYREALKFVRSLGLKNCKEWRIWAKSGHRPANIPGDPRSFYLGKGWVSWGEFLGTGFVALHCRKYLSYLEARKFARSKCFKSSISWRRWAKSEDRPENIPTNPDKVYRFKGWVSWGDFLGTGLVASSRRKYLTYDEAKAYVGKLGLQSSTQWRKWLKERKRPENIPADPRTVYLGTGWICWSDFLGSRL